jgi:hypothetical protein
MAKSRKKASQPELPIMPQAGDKVNLGQTISLPNAATKLYRHRLGPLSEERRRLKLANRA